MKNNVTVTWDDKEYTITEAEAFEVGEQVEEVMDINVLAQFKERPRFHKLARGYAEMVNFAAGQDVCTAKQVHAAFMKDTKEGASPQVSLAYQAAVALAEVLLDGAPEPDDLPVGGGEKPMGEE